MVVEWLEPLALTLGYPGVFLLSLIGTCSIVVPIPYTVVLLGLSTQPIFDPFLLAVAAGLGSGVGQVVSYLAGYAGRKVVSRKHEKRLEAMLTLFRRFGPLAVFIFALTPLPDSLLLLPLGILRFNFWMVFLPCLAGKFLMCLTITYFGRWVGEAVESPILAAATTILLILGVFAMFKINWEKLAERYAPPSGGKPKLRRDYRLKSKGKNIGVSRRTQLLGVDPGKLLGSLEFP